MVGLAAMTLAAGMAATPVAEPGERNIFRIPRAGDVRMQTLTRAGGETGWPFTVDEGLLMCVFVAGRPTVYFAVVEEHDEWHEDPPVRMVIVSTDPFDATLANMAVNDLIVETGGPAERMALFAPFERMGRRLCDQPRGTEMGPGEL
ncbi:MAG: hypothetical protein JJ926_07595 [Roseitalea sp.]|jgi:hypothetical protein|uniref:Uncharacterized protein n=1 Tax=Oceaniradius stylonematis TaxID=2184161 RepID=A0A3A8ABX5_9HYPH|nr:hypothetical protein [Oceaniradius stylonematis]MBO6551891.1 hypothetical protein [Roseitalea sp.]MBO6951729.1 hypothetical protein [Rhizobiaceae bacterium]RNC95828.1 MAG: hypothetical protein ED558_06585 [Oricola sp.]MBO6592425.1 hypothetical protein [Roseitalea sp.]MBO6598680.1 hypothetical protein [Roseitalea sp.]